MLIKIMNDKHNSVVLHGIFADLWIVQVYAFHLAVENTKYVRK